MRVFLSVLACLSLASCAQKTEPLLHGYLYFGASYYLGRLSLSSGRAESIARLGDIEIEHVGVFDNGQLLLSTSSSKSGQRRSFVVTYDTKKRRTRVLFPGGQAHYLPSPGIVIYDDGEALRTVPRNRMQGDSEVIFFHERRQAPVILVLSETEVLIASRPEGTQRILHYDVESHDETNLATLARTCELKGAVWIADRSQLLCKTASVADEQARYRLVSLNGEIAGELPLPVDKKLYALAYLEDQHAVVFSETWRGWTDSRDQYAIWGHFLDSGANHRISKHQFLGESVVYVRGTR